jgi:hypothetical protein
MPWDERARNVRLAVPRHRDFTGAALSEFARVLCKTGAAGVAGWVVARTLTRQCRSNYLRQSRMLKVFLVGCS